MRALADDAITLFTDGSCKPKPRRGGFGFRLVWTRDDGHEAHHDESPNGYPGATNNQMELRACIAALDFLRNRRCPVDASKYGKVVLLTDSKYVHDNLYMVRSGRWQANGWNRSSGPPVLNAELWRELHRAINRCALPVSFDWIPGKKGDHAKAVDGLAKDSADRPYNRPISHEMVRPKLDPENETDAGSVPMRGQVMTVYVVQAEYLRVQRVHRYRYEVVGGDLDGAIDWAYSDVNLRARHTYVVRFNADQDHPQIDDKLDEITVE
jgi:ribonuclease HI